jgi:hypothetical protein
MAVLKHRFHYHEDGSHYEKWLYLCRDTETREVYVEYERLTPKGEVSITKFSIEGFLASENSTATRKLRDLIGTLVADNQDA